MTTSSKDSKQSPAGVPDHGMTIVKTRGGRFQVSGDGPAYLTDPMSKRDCEAWIINALKSRAEIAAFNQAREDRIAAAGWVETPCADLVAGKEFCYQLRNKDLSRPRLIDRVLLFDNGGAMVYFSDSVPDTDPFTLMPTPSRTFMREPQPMPMADWDAFLSTIAAAIAA